ncbi:putative methyltransferase-like protein 15 homolog [Lycorma delicatula]|uniref:putative methyltransferase-like protein 15 homolog n=1 Tax=Lycorma delicatula TaxID=130591 RepID=UPI003F5168E0
MNSLTTGHYFNLFKKSTKFFFKRWQSTIAVPIKCESTPHIPVMKENVLKYLGLKPHSVLLDMTFGAGGHTKSVLESSPHVIVYCLDRDPVAYNYAVELEKTYPSQVIPLLGRFSELPHLFKKIGVKQNSIDGILFDFGCSSMQFDDPKRGFSVSKDGPLDMRMDGTRFPDNPTAADVLATADENDLYKIFKIYGEEKKSRKIARAIVEARYTFISLQSTQELGDFVASLFEKEMRLDKLKRKAHTATKIFQALRIFVNNEMNEINYAMILAHKYLKIGGRLVTLTFHSLEDCIVKRHLTGNVSDNSINILPARYISYNTWHDSDTMEELISSCWKSVNKHVITPSDYEVQQNPRSRSAKLRAAIKIK